MKISIAALMCTFAASAQNYPAGQLKQISVPITGSAQPLAVAAMEIDRELQYPSVIHLKGAVEIKMVFV